MSAFFSGVRTSSDTGFDAYDEFAHAQVPEPGSFLTDHQVMTGRDHLAFHRLARLLFEKRGVYDMTFGYNLARLNLDHRHPNAGYRYAVDKNDASILWAEFTPTTAFCPQSDTLARGSFRAFNGGRHRHQFDLVRVRVDEMHHRSAEINCKLRNQEERFLDTGRLPGDESTGQVGDNTQAQQPSDAPF